MARGSLKRPVSKTFVKKPKRAQAKKQAEAKKKVKKYKEIDGFGFSACSD